MPALLAILALLATACGRGSSGGTTGNAAGGSDPGITANSIKLGGSYPFSGPASAYGTIGVAAKAYFDMLNAKGGVNGRKIEFTTLDDSYEPARALQNVKRLIEQDKVFALFNTLGTPNNLAIWDYTNQQKVPQVFVATGASYWGADIAKHPFTIGWQPDYVSESRVYATYLKQNKPNATVAVLYQNDAYGKDLLNGFKDAVQGSGVKVTATESYEVTDPSVDSQVSKLASSKADVFLDVTTPKFAAQAIHRLTEVNWKPLHILNNVSASKALVLKPAGLEASKGIVSTTYFKDPEDPQWANDPAMMEYKAGLKQYAPKADVNEPFNVYGWAAANTMAEALKRMKQPTRASLMDAIRNMNLQIPLLLPGISVRTTPTDGYPIQDMQVMQFDGNLWQLQGNVIQTSQ
ncbi:MAG TPA: ABC transporter substrate-binding protein [Actinomycetota bacterium]|nr:ABC transporter substrate-binding protein [Actinomycetota bacterium]